MSTFERTVLPNRVRVITAPMDRVQSTACYVTVEAGSRYETAPENGVAHFVEHVLFCGTPRRPSVRALTGDVDQKKRLKILHDFKEGALPVLVATDVASRGLHIEGVSHVVNFTLPEDPDDYVHRIGRTGRAGASGTSISFACEDDAFLLGPIEELLHTKLPCRQPEPELLESKR